MKLIGSRIFLRLMEKKDFPLLLDYEENNTVRFRHVSNQAFKPLIDRLEIEMELKQEGRHYHYLIFSYDASETLIGEVILSQVNRHPDVLNATLSYSLDAHYEGQGFMSEALKLIIEYSFNVLHLHRLEAYVSPQNLKSIKALEKLKFKREGLARKNLRVNRQWQDHLVFSLLQEEFRS